MRHSKVREQELPSDDSNSDRQETSKAVSVKSQEVTVYPKRYSLDQQTIVCQRFPHSKICLCKDRNQPFRLTEVVPRLYISSFNSAMKTKQLLEAGITNIVNLSSRQYTKRNHYFNYLNLDILCNNQEDIKKNFRITNRYIADALKVGGTVLVHCKSGVEVSPCYALAFLISVKKTPLKVGLEQLSKKVNLQISSHFMRQLQTYDLQKLAFVSVKYKGVT